MKNIAGIFPDEMLLNLAFLANVNSRSRSLYAVARPSVVCRLSVVGNVRVPYSGGSNFRQYFYGIVPWPSADIQEKFYRDRPRGTPSSGM